LRDQIIEKFVDLAINPAVATAEQIQT